MPSSGLLRFFAATSVAFCAVEFANALPSFGTRIPNGENVPCPPSLVEEDNSGCTASGYCLGLGHPNCGGFQPEDKTEGNPPSILLSPFGEDWRSNGFLWTKELCELDSDGDGYTNGEELGDPCCTWSVGSPVVKLDLFEGFIPSHPGMEDDIPPVGFTFNRTSLCASIEDEDDTAEDEVDPLDKYYNPEERRGSFEFRIKPYAIPIKTTTYVDFVFNIPDDLPDLFHVVFGEAVISQPDHLHHFVLFGCTTKIDPELEGVPIDRPPRECSTMIGGWAPGSDLFRNTALDTGVVLGRGLGIEAIQLNVHYTDGVYDDPQTMTHRMATDGVRIHYTPDFRPFTGFSKQVIWVPFGPKEMYVPPNESRYFVSKTCSINTACQDISDEKLRTVAGFMGVANAGGDNSMIDELSCPGVRAFCFIDGQIGSAIQQLCPVTCGMCENTVDGQLNPRNPSSYRVTSINYHAHLLGTEMYATLLREVDEETEQELPQGGTIIQKQASGTDARATKIIAKDLKSREAWYYDDQASINMDYDIAIADPNDLASTTMIQGIEIKPGDKIHVACVYDSTGRDGPTEFGLSTYEEMCIIGLSMQFETPKSLLEKAPDGEDEAAFVLASAVDIYNDIKLRSFRCVNDDENHTTDIYQGFLTEEEDGRNIWFEHPIEESDMCTFPVADYVIVDSFITGESICPESPSQDEEDEEEEKEGTEICDGIPNVKFTGDAIAGYMCVGGTYDQQDSNEEPFYLTEEDCLEVGGGSEYEAYSCDEIQHWLHYEARTVPDMTDEMLEYLRTDWWQPKCCQYQSDGDDKSSVSADDNALPSTAACSISIYGNLLAFLMIATIVAMF